MIFITLAKFRHRPTKADTDRTNEVVKRNPQVKVKTIYWTFGRYDGVIIAEAPDEKTYMKFTIELEHISTETMVGIAREEALKII